MIMFPHLIQCWGKKLYEHAAAPSTVRCVAVKIWGPTTSHSQLNQHLILKQGCLRSRRFQQKGDMDDQIVTSHTTHVRFVDQSNKHYFREITSISVDCELYLLYSCFIQSFQSFDWMRQMTKHSELNWWLLLRYCPVHNITAYHSHNRMHHSVLHVTGADTSVSVTNV